MDNQQELFPVVDDQGNVIGSICRGEAHCGSKILHPVVHLHVFNSQGDLYLQHRPEWKDIQPNKWDTACGGHVALGESIEEALCREVDEELGIIDYIPVKLGQYIFEGPRERELVYVFKTIYDAPLHPNKEELAGGRFWSIEEIEQSKGKDIFTPNFESEHQRFFGCS